VTQRAGQAVEKRLEETAGKIDERLGEEAGKELRDALKGLFD